MAQLKSTVVQGALTVTGNVVANKLIKLGGTDDQILMADGNVKTIDNLITIPSISISDTGTKPIVGDITSSGHTVTVTRIGLDDLGLASAYKYKGSKSKYSDLPTSGNTTGDVWNVTDTGMNYAWTGTAWDALGSTIDTSGFVSATKNTGIPVAGTEKDTYTYNKTAIFAPNGLIMGGTAAAAGLVTRGVCGVTEPDEDTGECTKDNLYLNYDGNNTWSPSGRGVVINAGSVGTNLGSNMYSYCAVRGDVVKAWVEARGYLTSESDTLQTVTNRGSTTTNAIKIQNGAAAGCLILGGNVGATGLTANTRKLARVTVPDYTDITKTVAIFSADANSNSLHSIEFGSRQGDGTSYAPNLMSFSVGATAQATDRYNVAQYQYNKIQFFNHESGGTDIKKTPSTSLVGMWEFNNGRTFINNGYTYTLPNETGTIALTSDLPADYIKIVLNGNSGTLTAEQHATMLANPHKVVFNRGSIWYYAENLGSTTYFYTSQNVVYSGSKIQKHVLGINPNSNNRTWTYTLYEYDPGVGNATITLTAGKGLTGGESFTTNQSTNEEITFNVGAGTGISVADDAVALATYGTAGTYGPTSNATLSHGGTFTVPKVVTDDYGRVTAASITYTLPADNDTKNTAGSTNSDSKLFLIGATSQAANPQTYSDSEVYTTDGTLTTKKVQVGGGTTTLQYNSTEGCLEFVFA